MENNKRKYKFKGYLVRKTISSDGTIKETRTYVGDTFAVSKEKAINNIKFRQIGKQRNTHTSYGYEDNGIIETYDAEFVG